MTPDRGESLDGSRIVLSVLATAGLSDALGFALIVFAPGVIFVVGGAAIGAGIRWVIAQRSA